MKKNYTSEKHIEGELGLNSCGEETLSDRNYQIKRQRVDYSLMYVAKGRATMNIGRKRTTVSEGEALFYPPETKQEYVFRREDNSINKWVHFGGKKASLLDAGGARKIEISRRKEFENALDGLINAYNGISGRRETLIEGYLTVLIALLLESESGENKSGAPFSNKIGEALNYIHINAYSDVDLDYAASLCYMSRDRFNHVFKETTGYPPGKYLSIIRIERAKALLSDIGMTPGECAKSVGFSDPNYFCRVFRKETGVSPREYRESGKKQ